MTMFYKDSVSFCVAMMIGINNSLILRFEVWFIFIEDNDLVRILVISARRWLLNWLTDIGCLLKSIGSDGLLNGWLTLAHELLIQNFTFVWTPLLGLLRNLHILNSSLSRCQLILSTSGDSMEWEVVVWHFPQMIHCLTPIVLVASWRRCSKMASGTDTLS